MRSNADQLYDLYCRCRNEGKPVSLKIWSTTEGEFFNLSNLPSSTSEPQRHWQSNKPLKPVKYKSPCRRRRDLKRWEQRQATQGAGHPVQGVGHSV